MGHNKDIDNHDSRSVSNGNIRIQTQEKTPKEKLLVKLGNQNVNYPPYNFICIEKAAIGSDNSQQEEIYILELAVAGFGYKNLTITLSESYLTVEGKSENADYDYIYQGIASRNFKQMFKVHESMRLAGEAHLENGILRLMFIRETHNDKVVKTIPIYITTLKIAG